MLTFLFWFLGLASIYSYALYPFALIVLKRFGKSRDLTVDSSRSLPSLTLIVTAYNEEKRIRDKIKNTLEISYPKGLLELIVASDCSDDATDQIASEYYDQGVRVVRANERLGKENAQLAAIQVARGEILVFSDVATQIPQDALTLLANYFTDPSVGAVSSEDRFVSKDGALAGEGAYVKYEMWLRQQESRLAGLVGLSGSFFAARKTICSEWDIHSPSDFNTALNAAKHGLRAVTAPDVLGIYSDLADPAKEYARKIRTVIRGMTGLSRHREVLNFSKFGIFSFQVVSHKLMRWLAPWLLIAFFLVSAILSNEGFFFGLIFVLQLLFYGVALIAHFVPELCKVGLVKLIYFFVQVHVALIDAGLKFLSGKRMTTWKPSAR